MRAAPLLVVTLLAIIAQPALGQNEQEVGVINVPPQFAGFQVGQTNGHYTVIVSASDVNGWADITNVTVEIADAAGGLAATFQFRQYNSTGSRTNEFHDVEGDWLQKNECSARTAPEGDLFSTRCLINLTFKFVPGEGEKIRVSISDRFGLNATGVLPYKWGEMKLPDFLRTPQATLSISGAIALAVTSIIVRGRMASNRLAISIERRRTRKAEESLDEIMARLEEEK